MISFYKWHCILGTPYLGKRCGMQELRYVYDIISYVIWVILCFTFNLYCSVLQAATSHKLPALYLIDSIIKNVSNSNYLPLFTRKIVDTFIFVFDKVSSRWTKTLDHDSDK